jgi:Pretoxin HINT domain
MKKRIACCLFLFFSVAHTEGIIEGTLVKTPSGYIEIQKIKVGDLVLSCDFESRCTSKAVTQVFEKEAGGYLEIHIGQSVIGCDEDHPFYSPTSKGWILAKNLRQMTAISSKANQKAKKNEIYYVSEKTKLYTLSVFDENNFHVTNDDVLVRNHNNATEANDSTIIKKPLFYQLVAVLAVTTIFYLARMRSY